MTRSGEKASVWFKKKNSFVMISNQDSFKQLMKMRTLFDPKLAFEELQADPLAYLPDQMVSQLWVDWIDLAVREADIVVASKVGTWARESHGILPPPSE
jgi:hypothetical protein